MEPAQRISTNQSSFVELQGLTADQIEDRLSKVALDQLLVYAHQPQLQTAVSNLLSKNWKRYIQNTEIPEKLKAEVFSLFINSHEPIKNQHVNILITDNNYRSLLEEAIKYKHTELCLFLFNDKRIMKNPDHITTLLSIFEKNDLDSQIRFTKILATYGGTMSAFIHRYGIKDESALIEIAKIAAAKEGRISEDIQNYGIKDESALIEIAKIAAAQKGWPISKYIQNYGIKDESALIEIAKIAAQNGWGTSEYIQNYGIKNEPALIEIAKIAAAQNGLATSEYIQNYGIKNEPALIEIATIAVAEFKDGFEAISKYIQNYDIKNESALIEIAKIAAQNGWGTSEYIQWYRIKNEAALIEIAKIAAAQNGLATSKYIQNYGIKNESALIEIAKIAAAQDGLGTSNCLENYGIKNELAKIEILKIAAAQRAFAIAYGSSESSLNGADLERLYALSPHLQTIKEETITDDRLWQKWLTWRFVLLAHSALQVNDLKWLENNDILKILWDFKDPDVRLKVSTQTKTLIEEKDFFEGITLDLNKHTKLPAVLLCALKKQGLSKDTLQAVAERISANRKFKEGKYQKNLMRMLQDLHDNQTLKPHDKERVLKILFPDLTALDQKLTVARKLKGEAKQSEIDKINKEIHGEHLRTLQKITVVEGILGIDPSQLTEKIVDEIKEDLGSLLQTLFQKTLPIGEIVDFTAKYEAFVTNFRSPQSLLTYASSLKKLSSPDQQDTLALLGQFFESVLNKNFKNRRYPLEPGKHLESVFKDDKIKKKWIEGQVWSFEQFLNPKTEEQSNTVNLFEIFKQKILQDQHIDDQAFPFLVSFLKDPSKKEQLLKTLQEESRLGKEASLQLQMLCIEVSGQTLDRKAQIEGLDRIKKLLAEATDLKGVAEFKHDIQGLFKGLTAATASSRFKECKVVDSDDPADLLLSGTEIEGSCQRINGDPDLNKCLLAYLLDGKNRLIAVKNSEGNLVARCFLRLLYDEKNKTPVLFLERVYPNIVSNEVRQALIQAAKSRAQTLGLTLTSKEVKEAGKEGLPYTGGISSLGSIAPYEYVDASNGVTPNGLFGIANAHVLQEGISDLRPWEP